MCTNPFLASLDSSAHSHVYLVTLLVPPVLLEIGHITWTPRLFKASLGRVAMPNLSSLIQAKEPCSYPDALPSPSPAMQ